MFYRYIISFVLLLTSLNAAVDLRTPLGPSGKENYGVEESDAASVRSSATGYSARGRVAAYVMPTITAETTGDEIIAEYLKLHRAYKELADSIQRTNAKVSQFLKGQIAVLEQIPGVVNRAAGSASRDILEAAIGQLVIMYQALERTPRDGGGSEATEAVGALSLAAAEESDARVRELESTIETLQAETVALQRTIAALEARLASRETREMATNVTPGLAARAQSKMRGGDQSIDVVAGSTEATASTPLLQQDGKQSKGRRLNYVDSVDQQDGPSSNKQGCPCCMM